MATIKDIARAAQVSVATVSNVLNNKSNVGAETREKILAICRELNYYPNILARNLKTGKTNAVMFIFSDFQREFYLRIIHGINDCLMENDVRMLICPNISVDNFLKNGLVDGAIVLDQSIRDKQILDAAHDSVPIVVMDRLLEAKRVSCIVTDNRASMEELTRKLIEKGYRRFHYVGGIAHTCDHIERFDAFQRTLAQHGIPFEQMQYYQGDYSLRSGKRIGNIMALGSNLPDVVVCANDSMAAGVIEAFREQGIDVPGMVAVSGFDGDPQANLPAGFLTTAKIPRYEMGYLAAETLLDMIRLQTAGVIRKIRAPIQIKEST